MRVKTGGNKQFDPNHAGIKMVDTMRGRGLDEEQIRNHIREHEIGLQEKVNAKFIRPHSITPSQEDIDQLRKLEVARTYADIDDLSRPGSMEKIAKAQRGENPTSQGNSMSQTWQVARNEADAAKPAERAKPGEVSLKM